MFAGRTTRKHARFKPAAPRGLTTPGATDRVSTTIRTAASRHVWWPPRPLPARLSRPPLRLYAGRTAETARPAPPHAPRGRCRALPPTRGGQGPGCGRPTPPATAPATGVVPAVAPPFFAQMRLSLRRAVRHHSASVASHSTANIKLPHCQRWALPSPDDASAGVAVDLFVEVCAI